MKTPHYLRFVQALTLAAVVPACSGAPVDDAEPARVSEPVVPTAATAPRPIARPIPESAQADASSDHDADVDASLPFSSGPIVPPEMA